MMRHKISQRQVCRVLGVNRSLLANFPKQLVKNRALIEPIKILSVRYPRFGYRRIGAMLTWQEGERIKVKRIYWICSILNLQLPQCRLKGKRLAMIP